MARVKKEAEVQVDTVETQVETVETQAPQATNKIEAAEPVDDMALRALKRFNGLEYAYVNKYGGVFTVDTPVHLVKKAVLYKNPYFTNQ